MSDKQSQKEEKNNCNSGQVDGERFQIKFVEMWKEWLGCTADIKSMVRQHRDVERKLLQFFAKLQDSSAAFSGYRKLYKQDLHGCSSELLGLKCRDKQHCFGIG